MAQENLSDHAELIRAYNQSVHSRAVARRCTSLLVMGVIFVHVGLLWAEFNDFRYRRMPEFCSALSTQAADMAPALSKDLMDVVNRVYPYYVTVFDQMFQRDLPTFESTLQSHMAQLNDHAQAEWPLIEKGILDLVLTTEEVTLEVLNTILTPEEAKAVSASYGEAIGKRYTEYFDTRLHRHVAVAQNIGQQLSHISTLEPDMDRPVELNEALGLLLELSGIELQRGF